jgi:hypothetical protein
MSNDKKNTTITACNQCLLETLYSIANLIKSINQHESEKQVINNLLKDSFELSGELKKHINLISIDLLIRINAFLKAVTKEVKKKIISLSVNHQNINFDYNNNIIKAKDLINKSILAFTTLLQTVKNQLPDPNSNQGLTDDTKANIIRVENQLKDAISNLKKIKSIFSPKKQETKLSTSLLFSSRSRKNPNHTNPKKQISHLNRNLKSTN